MFLPFAIGFSASSIVSGPIANRIGARIINLGTFLMALGLLSIIAFTQISNATSGSGAVSLQLLVPIFFVYGLGQGLAQPALINTVIGGAGVTGDDAGSAVGHCHINFEQMTRSPTDRCCAYHTEHRAHVSCFQTLNASERMAR
jgi:nitrate/nitrite transporter NarK